MLVIKDLNKLTIVINIIYLITENQVLLLLLFIINFFQE